MYKKYLDKKKCKEVNDAEILHDYQIASELDRRAIQNCLFDKLFDLYTYYNERKYPKLGSEEVLSAYCNAQLKLFRSIEADIFRAQASIKTYFEVILSRECIDLLRKKSSIIVSGPETIPEKVDENANHVEHHIAAETYERRLNNLRDLMEKLSDKCRMIIQLYQYGCNFDEIAVTLNYKTSVVAKERFFQCKKRLISLYQEKNCA